MDYPISNNENINDSRLNMHMRLITTILLITFLSSCLTYCSLSVPSLESKYAEREVVERQLQQVAAAFNELSGKVHALEQENKQAENK